MEMGTVRLDVFISKIGIDTLGIPVYKVTGKIPYFPIEAASGDGEIRLRFNSGGFNVWPMVILNVRIEITRTIIVFMLSLLCKSFFIIFNEHSHNLKPVLKIKWFENGLLLI